jgi:hypothetical protein
LTADSVLLLPRPYPGFQPLWFKSEKNQFFDLSQAEKIEITIGQGLQETQYGKPHVVEIESVLLSKE